jgi:hypothetical protein
LPPEIVIFSPPAGILMVTCLASDIRCSSKMQPQC